MSSRLPKQPLPATERQTKIRNVVRVSSGNFVEMYDFMVYGYYAKYIGDTFFPSDDPYASLMLSLATFGAGFLMRPLGAIVLGAYIDRFGRRNGLLLTLTLMAFGTLTIAVTPGYASWGPVAPFIVVVGRLLQGLSAGVESGGVSVYLAEIATRGNRGFYCAFQSVSQQVAVIFAALFGVALTFFLSPTEISQWGWRVPLMFGCFIIPVIFWLRRSLQETEVFQQRRMTHRTRELLTMLAVNWRSVVVGMMISVFTTTSFYMITAYTPTFGSQALHLSTLDSMLVTVLVGFSNLVWVPIGGALSDRIGRLKPMFAMPILAIFTVYPVMSMLVEAPTFGKLLGTVLWTSMMFGIYNGAMVPRIVEIVPPAVRTAAFSLAFSLAAAVFGGFTPAISTWLIEITGNRAAPALWLSFAAAISLTGMTISTRMGRGHAEALEPLDPVLTRRQQ